MINVTIIQRILPHYRVSFFKKLHDALLDGGVAMSLIYGQEQSGTVPETVKVEYEWATYKPNRYFKILNTELIYQNIPKSVASSDLVIIEQANRLISNYKLLAARQFKGTKVAYWGHGMNFQSHGTGRLKEAIKKAMLTRVDWWFAYTKLSADIVKSRGFSENRISILNNAIDNQSFISALDRVTEQNISELYRSLDIKGKYLCLYCGGLYAEKKIEFLIKSAVRIRKDNPKFELIVIGSGPCQEIVQGESDKHEWLHYVGPKYGDDKARYFKAAKLLLMPGLVGLAILDSFISKTPIVTTDIPIHSPEISYLDHGRNGLICNFDEFEYAKTVNDCLRNQALYDKLISGCEASAFEYTMDKMVQNFKQGIIDCLNI